MRQPGLLVSYKSRDGPAKLTAVRTWHDAGLTGDELIDIHSRVCHELIRAHDRLRFLFRALDAFPDFVRSLDVPPPSFFNFWSSRWVGPDIGLCLTHSQRC